MTKQTCKTCHFRVINAQRVAECRATPPSVLPLIGQDRLGQPSVLGHVTSFPIVQEGMWCGAWREITEARPELPILSKLLMPTMNG